LHGEGERTGFGWGAADHAICLHTFSLTDGCSPHQGSFELPAVARAGRSARFSLRSHPQSALDTRAALTESRSVALRKLTRPTRLG
jgi:hypothetical protein